MKHSISVLDFDCTYNMQTYFEGTDYERISFLDIKNTNRYCEEKSLIDINKRLKKRKNKGITFIGSGNYHYVTYLLMSEINQPFTLILFDHHSDMLNPYFKVFISCGSWVLNALEGLPMLRKVIIIGARRDLCNIIPPRYNGLVTVFTEDEIEEKTQDIELKRYIDSAILTNSVYISIDKDVLSKSEAVTNWDQGSMKIEYLLDLIEYISINKEILGVDICGEYSCNPVERFYRESIRAVEKNDKANLEILNMLKNLNIHHPE